MSYTLEEVELLVRHRFALLRISETTAILVEAVAKDRDMSVDALLAEMAMQWIEDHPPTDGQTFVEEKP